MTISTNFIRRRGVTLLEVIFSIGVVLIGLVGVASILPLAGRRAQDSISMSVGSAMSDAIFQELQARGYLAQSLYFEVAGNTTVNRGNVDALTPGSFCIDPLFVADLSVNSTIPPPVLSNRYSGRLFPYYLNTHDPTQDPSTAYSELWPVVQPRMLRVGILSQTAVPTASISIEEARALVERTDDLPYLRPTDRTLSAVVKGASATGTGSTFGKKLVTGEYSWIATVNPLPGNEYASISIVIIRNRDRGFDLPTTTTAPVRPDGNLLGERLAYVTFANGFRGGAGGVVHLVSNANTVSTIQTNDWLMLSRTNSAGQDIHRWYRVSAVDGDAERLTRTVAEDSTSPGFQSGLPGSGSREIWSRRLYLDGPDWSFNVVTSTMPPGYADTSFADNTIATLVEGVVTVSEKVVSLNSL